MKSPSPDFLKHAGRILNSGQARTLLLTGNIYDLFRLPEDAGYAPLIGHLTASWNLPELVLIVYELNGPIRFACEEDMRKVREAWIQWRCGLTSEDLAIKRMLAKGREAAELDTVTHSFEESLRGAINNPTLALEWLRQLCLCSRTLLGGKRFLEPHLLIVIEGADLLIPDAPIHNLSDVDRHRVSICHDWFSDPAFVNGSDSVVLIAESRSLLHHRIARLPQLLEVEIPAPDLETRAEFIRWFIRSAPPNQSLSLWGTVEELAALTAGLSLHALQQLLKGARHENRRLEPADVIGKVEEFIQSQLGEDIVEFKKPSHTFEDVVGFRRLKAFLKNDLLPRFQMQAKGETITGAAVCGPIGGGKTFIFEALAAELDLVVLVLKNIRSQWFGQTDVIFERLRRVLNALSRVLIFIDEADTQFGGVGAETHETERRLTGKLQAMMSDPQFRGRVFWMLITARIHQLSPDLRRPGRVGDLIIPTLDPEGEDREDFIRWAVDPVLENELTPGQLEQLNTHTRNYSAAAFASLRSELRAKARASGGRLRPETLLEVVHDQLSPAIEQTRRYQTLQALVNCTRRSLLPDPAVSDEQRREWAEEIRTLEARGIR